MSTLLFVIKHILDGNKFSLQFGIQTIPSIYNATSEDDLKILNGGNLLAPEVGIYEGYRSKKPEGLTGMPFGGGGVIKSIQRDSGLIPTSSSLVNIPINQVDMGSSILRLSFEGDSSNYLRGGTANIVFRNDSEIQIKKTNTSGDPLEYRWEVIEFNNVKGIQRGETYTSGNDYIDININQVDLNKALLFASVRFDDNSINKWHLVLHEEFFKDNTSLRFEWSENVYSAYIAWQVVEFK